MENKFYVGQTVISLITTSSSTATKLVKNQEYEILAIRKGCSHHPVLLDVGSYNPDTLNKSRCDKCDLTVDGLWAPSIYFRPKDQLPAEKKKEDNQFKEVTFTKIKELVPAQSEN